MLFFDSHCHLQDFSSLPILERNIGGLLSLSTKEDDWDKTLSLKNSYENISLAIGIHPWYCDKLSSSWLEKLENILIADIDISVGEIGLDFKLCTVDETVQIETFKSQLSLAKKHNRICSIHNINRWDLLFNILDEGAIPAKGAILHSFNGSLEVANRLINLGFYISISTNIIGASKKIKDVVKNLPLDRLLIETDSPYQVPISWVENKSSPNYINRVYQEIADIKSISIDKLSKAVEENFRSAFN